MKVKERPLSDGNRRPTGDGTAPLPAGPAPHLLHVFPSYGHGGVPIRIATVINHFGDRYRHTIFALDGNMAAQSRLDPSLRVRVADPGIDKGHPLLSLLHIRRILRAETPDLLLTYNWGSVEWALIDRVFRIAPQIHFESGFGPEEADGQIRRRVMARRVALAGVRQLVVPSRTLVSLARDIWRIAPDKIGYIPNGVDCALFGGAGDPDAVPALVRRPDELILGTVAPLRAEKNLQRLLRVFAEVAPRHQTRLLIAGDGPERGSLEDAARALAVHDRVVFAGHVDRPEKVFPLIDVFAMSSDTEQMPNTLIQAMAAGCPVAAVDVGDIRHNLSPENRPYVVPKGDDAALAAVIAGLLSDPALRSALSRANRTHVNAHYTHERMFAAYGAAFDAAMASARKVRSR